LRLTLASPAACPKNESNGPRPALGLTESEERVLACLAEGMRHKEIAERLGVSLKMVEKLLQGIFHKLGVRNGVTAVLKWLGVGVRR
jgi:DNA-binding NarL/FixJ family response regulator